MVINSLLYMHDRNRPSRLRLSQSALGGPISLCYDFRPIVRWEIAHNARSGGSIGFLAFTSVVLSLSLVVLVQGQQMIQYGFEARDPVWVQGAHDAAYKETLHRLTDEFVHDGQRSETIQLDAERGSFIHYTYAVGKAPITEDFTVSLWVRANRPGVQLLARVVFPRDKDANNPDQPLTALLPGDRYSNANHWQLLSLPAPMKLLRQQQQLLSGNLKREVVATDAYIDELVLNVYS